MSPLWQGSAVSSSYFFIWVCPSMSLKFTLVFFALFRRVLPLWQGSVVSSSNLFIYLSLSLNFILVDFFIKFKLVIFFSVIRVSRFIFLFEFVLLFHSGWAIYQIWFIVFPLQMCPALWQGLFPVRASVHSLRLELWRVLRVCGLWMHAMQRGVQVRLQGALCAKIELGIFL